MPTYVVPKVFTMGKNTGADDLGFLTLDVLSNSHPYAMSNHLTIFDRGCRSP